MLKKYTISARKGFSLRETIISVYPKRDSENGTKSGDERQKGVLFSRWFYIKTRHFKPWI